MLNGLSLFSGIGGIDIALAPWVRPIAYCENDEWAQALLLQRQASGDLPLAPIWDDVRTLRSEHLGVDVDLIYGGFPCQDISLAGSRKGLDGERSSLFYEIVRLSQELSPGLVFLENVWPGIKKFVPTIRNEFESIGFECRDGFLSAADVGANHLRRRWFLLAAHPERLRLWQQPEWLPGRRQGELCAEREAVSGNHGEARSLANSPGERRGEGRPWQEVWGWPANSVSHGCAFESSWWTTEPNVGRVAHGVSARVVRVRGLGNAVVPLQARLAFQILAGGLYLPAR